LRETSFGDDMQILGAFLRVYSIFVKNMRNISELEHHIYSAIWNNAVIAVHPRTGHEGPDVQFYFFFNLVARWEWV
jgi:hypothetical protein